MTAENIDRIVAGVLDQIDGTPDAVAAQGFVTLPTDVRDRDTGIAVLHQLGTWFGGLSPHTADRQLADITTTEQFNDHSVVRPQSDNGPQYPHTDAVLSLELPAVLAMLCVGRAEEGGHSVLVDTRPFLAEYGPTGFLDPLFDSNAVSVVRGELAAEISVLRRRGPYVDVAFSDHEYNTAVPKPECAPPFAALRDYAGTQAAQQRVLLAPGELLLVANRFGLHGREAFRNGPNGTRHFVRAWYLGGVPRSAWFDGHKVDW